MKREKKGRDSSREPGAILPHLEETGHHRGGAVILIVILGLV